MGVCGGQQEGEKVGASFLPLSQPLFSSPQSLFTLLVLPLISAQLSSPTEKIKEALAMRAMMPHL